MIKIMGMISLLFWFSFSMVFSENLENKPKTLPPLNISNETELIFKERKRKTETTYEDEEVGKKRIRNIREMQKPRQMRKISDIVEDKTVN